MAACFQVPVIWRLCATFRSCNAACCSAVSSMSRTHVLTDDTETPTRRAISLIDAPSSRRSRLARSRSRVFTIENIREASDRAGGENRTPVSGLETRSFATKLRPRSTRIAYRRGSLFVGAALGRSRRNCGTRGGVLLDATPLALRQDATRRLRSCADLPAGGVRDTAAHDR